MSLAVLLYLFYGLMFFYVIFSLFNIYHLLRFGSWSFVNFSVILVYVLLSLWLFVFSLQVLWGFDWQSPLFSADALKQLIGNFKLF